MWLKCEVDLIVPTLEQIERRIGKLQNLERKELIMTDTNINANENTNENAEKKPILNLEVNNFRKADSRDGNEWSRFHAECDVYLNGKFITTYKWNPGFYNVHFPKDDRDRFYIRDWAKKTSSHLRKVVLYLCDKYGTKQAEKTFGIWLGTGRYWNTKFTDDSSYDKLTKEIWSEIEPVYPDLYDVESALVSDAQCIESSITFEDFCDDLGYSKDSIRALKIYAACQETYGLLIRSGKWDELKTLHEND